MSLELHLLLHFLFSLLAGSVAWWFWHRPILSFGAALFGGFLIDFDHFIDYLLAFGLNFNPVYFSNGYYGLKSGKIFYFLHGWEYAIIFLVACLIVQKSVKLKSIFLALALGILFHLSIDASINEGMKNEGYSVIFRASNDFEIEKIVTPEDYQRYLIKKQEVKF